MRKITFGSILKKFVSGLALDLVLRSVLVLKISIQIYEKFNLKSFSLKGDWMIKKDILKIWEKTNSKPLEHGTLNKHLNQFLSNSKTINFHAKSPKKLLSVLSHDIVQSSN